jgi:hypothetical protein
MAGYADPERWCRRPSSWPIRLPRGAVYNLIRLPKLTAAPAWPPPADAATRYPAPKPPASKTWTLAANVWSGLG